MNTGYTEDAERRTAISADAEPNVPAPLPAKLRHAIAPWIEAAGGDEDLALVILHAELRSRLRASAD